MFIEGPPHGQSQPTHVVKYLARYMSGGPIADRRLISHEQDQVTFWARTKDKANKSQPLTLAGEEFVRRWSMHILPKGYTRSRSYGGFHSTKRAKYLARCRELLPAPEREPTKQTELNECFEPSMPKCERCQVEMALIDHEPRPSWSTVFEVIVFQAPIYSPTHHIDNIRLPEAHPIEGYG